jgi:hypothetical protein
MLSGVLGTRDGSITFVNMETQEDYVMIKLKHAITKLELVSTPSFKVGTHFAGLIVSI